MIFVDLEHLFACDAVIAGHVFQHLFHFNGNGTVRGERDGMLFEHSRGLDRLDLASQRVADGVEQSLVFLGGGFCGGLFLFGFKLQIAASDVFEFLVLVFVYNL